MEYHRPDHSSCPTVNLDRDCIYIHEYMLHRRGGEKDTGEERRRRGEEGRGGGEEGERKMRGGRGERRENILRRRERRGEDWRESPWGILLAYFIV